MDLLKKIEALESLREVESKDISIDGYGSPVRSWMNHGWARVFLLGNTIYGIVYDPPPFKVKNMLESPEILWFSYYITKDNKIRFSAQVNLGDILELLDDDIRDEIIFNLDLLT